VCSTFEWGVDPLCLDQRVAKLHPGRDINDAVHSEGQRLYYVASQDHAVSVPVQLAEMTGADRAWAPRYQVGDVRSMPGLTFSTCVTLMGSWSR
jgi:hypothetical protein